MGTGGDGNVNDLMGVRGNGNGRSHSRTPVVLCQKYMTFHMVESSCFL